jgi:hypothetical protein
VVKVYKIQDIEPTRSCQVKKGKVSQSREGQSESRLFDLEGRRGGDPPILEKWCSRRNQSRTCRESLEGWSLKHIIAMDLGK